VGKNVSEGAEAHGNVWDALTRTVAMAWNCMTS